MHFQWGSIICPLKRNYITKLVSETERNAQPWIGLQPTESLFISAMNLFYTQRWKAAPLFSFFKISIDLNPKFMWKVKLHCIVLLNNIFFSYNIYLGKCSSCVFKSIFHLVVITATLSFISSSARKKTNSLYHFEC